MTAVRNRIPTVRMKRKRPYEALFGTKPTGIILRIWGSRCYTHMPKTKRTNHKLSERAIAHITCSEPTPQAKSVVLAKGEVNTRQRLIYDKKTMQVIFELYANVIFANYNVNRKSVTGYVCITWKSSRQSTVSIHIAQAELIAASKWIKESEWLQPLLEELGFKQTQSIVCSCDNKGAIGIIKDPANHKPTKHIDNKELYAREIPDKGRIVVKHT
ncbi:putative transposable element [Phytophthora palmivora]|uniref:Transposable element n=1 Tax=Phytophthora palmivora TaxID=4796 RepID=A0A2P4XVZ3_9STRA|nr:putative transposable element [Phytophthora palmivora]